jgi:hypothetical protein
MKVLSIEQKAKRYDEALPQLKGLLDGVHEEKCDIMEEDIIKIFPELKESKDDRIRKAIIEHFAGSHSSMYPYKGFTKKQFLAWLEKQREKEKFIKKELDCIRGYRDEAIKRLNEIEKQGEQKPTDKKGMNLVEEEMTPFQKKVFCIIDTAIEEEQGLKQVCDELFALASNEIKQKSAWSEEDENAIQVLKDIVKHSDEINENIYTMPLKEKLYDWLKSLKDRVQPQPKQEWSEEVSPYYDDICEILINLLHSETANVNKTAIQKDLDWLKSIRPQKQWKPSDEQIQALVVFCFHNFILLVSLNHSSD